MVERQVRIHFLDATRFAIWRALRWPLLRAAIDGSPRTRKQTYIDFDDRCGQRISRRNRLSVITTALSKQVFTPDGTKGAGAHRNLNQVSAINEGMPMA